MLNTDSSVVCITCCILTALVPTSGLQLCVWPLVLVLTHLWSDCCATFSLQHPRGAGMVASVLYPMWHRDPHHRLRAACQAVLCRRLLVSHLRAFMRASPTCVVTLFPRLVLSWMRDRHDLCEWEYFSYSAWPLTSVSYLWQWVGDRGKINLEKSSSRTAMSMA